MLIPTEVRVLHCVSLGQISDRNNALLRHPLPKRFNVCVCYTHRCEQDKWHVQWMKHKLFSVCVCVRETMMYVFSVCVSADSQKWNRLVIIWCYYTS